MDGNNLLYSLLFMYLAVHIYTMLYVIISLAMSIEGRHVLRPYLVGVFVTAAVSFWSMYPA